MHGAHSLDMEKLGRGATSYMHKLLFVFNGFETVFQGDSLSSNHFPSGGYITLIFPLYIRIYGSINNPWPKGFAFVLRGLLP